MRRRNSRRRAAALGLLSAGALLLALLPVPPAARAQQRIGRTPSGDFKLSVDVDLVVLHTTVVDDTGRHISELGAPNFRIFEDNVPQKLARFLHEDVPITVGLVLDNSGSMQVNRPSMMAGALRFAEAANKLDEMFVVNFNQDFYLDLEGKDFTNNLDELKEALGRTRTSGLTAFRDAVRASLNHLKKGTRQKRALLVISDAVDNASLTGSEGLLRTVQESEAALYFVALPCSEEIKGRDCKKAQQNMRNLAQISGGLAYFPTTIESVEAICRQIAHDIRNQYVLGYYPTNKARDGSFRTVRVQVIPPKGYKGLVARTRTGYYAAGPASAGSQ
jgi:VWFA-related protein